MQGRETFLQELVEKIDGMIEVIEERENIEPDFSFVREYAEQLREELRSLQDE